LATKLNFGQNFVSLLKIFFNRKVMESITIYPKNSKQQSLLKSLLEEMKVRFEIATKDETLLTKKEFVAKIDKSIAQAKSGKTKILVKDKQKEFLGL
jgi:hypothetical protein